MIIGVSNWLRPHLLQVAVAFIATVLFIFAGDINAWIRRRIRRKHFVVRTGIFVMLCAFGYGAFTVAAASVLATLAGALTPSLLAPVAAAAFILVGIIAERKKQI